MNKIQDSSEEALGSDMDLDDLLDVDIDDDDDEEYDSDDAAEDDSHLAEEDPAAEGSSQLKVNSLEAGDVWAADGFIGGHPSVCSGSKRN